MVQTPKWFRMTAIPRGHLVHHSTMCVLIVISYSVLNDKLFILSQEVHGGTLKDTPIFSYSLIKVDTLRRIFHKPRPLSSPSPPTVEAELSLCKATQLLLQQSFAKALNAPDQKKACCSWASRLQCCCSHSSDL